MAHGQRLRYEPSAVVRHAVPKERLTKEYLLAFWFDHGRASVREWGDRPGILGVPIAYLRMVKIGLFGLATTLEWILALDSQRRFHSKGRVWMRAGQILELYRQSAAARHAVPAAIQQRGSKAIEKAG